MHPSRFSILLLVSLAAWAQAPPQQQAAPPATAAQAKPAQEAKPGDTGAQFRAGTTEVVVPVTVTDVKDRFVSNLTVNDFRVFEDGKEQKIVYFSAEHNQPIVVGFLLDLSNASRLHWKTFQDTAMELVWNLLPGDRESRMSGFLVTYATDAELAVDTTSDSEKIVDRLRKVKPGGGAALYDAIYLACTKHSLVKGEPISPRRVLIVIGDGNDNSSKYTLDQVVEIAQRNQVTVYGVSTVAYGFTSEGEKNLTRLAEETGGRVEYPLQGVYADVPGFLSQPSDEGNYALKVGTGGYATQIARGLFNAIAKIAGEITTQYVIRYAPSGQDEKTFRSIKVEVNLPDVKVRARKGYYAGNP
jgi:Ca-activated chloride channel family protein